MLSIFSISSKEIRLVIQMIFHEDRSIYTFPTDISRALKIFLESKASRIDIRLEIIFRIFPVLV